MDEQKDRNSGLLDNDPFPKDVWEIAYKNTGGKPFEKENSLSAIADEHTEVLEKSDASKLTPEQQHLKAELKAKQERKASGKTKNKPSQGYNTAFISGVADSKSPPITPPANPTFRDSNSAPSLHSTGTRPTYEPEDEDDEEIENFEDLISKLLKKPLKEIKKAFTGEDFDEPTVTITVIIIVLVLIVLGLLGL